MLATDLYTHLDDLSGSLTQMIEAVNALSTGPGSQQDGANNSMSGGPNGLNEDPMNQIAQILSSHLESLQWIDGSVKELEGSVAEVEKRVREAGLSVNGGGSGGHGRSTRSIGYGLR
jgi:nuclear pore complex protein Nup62